MYPSIRKLTTSGAIHFLIPFLAFCMLFGVYLHRMQHEHRKDPENRTRALTFHGVFLAGRYDQGIYRGIGAVGYSDGKRVGWYPGAAIPGGIAWRLMGRPMESEGGKFPFRMGFYVPSILAGLMFFNCFYHYCRKKWGTRTALWSMLSLLCFPSSFYFLTAFPYNYSLVCMFGYLLLYESNIRGRYIWLGLLAFYGSLTYPTALLFAAVPLIMELRAQQAKKQFRLMPYVLYALPFVLGVIAFYGHLYVAVGDFFAYVNHQGRNHSRDFGNPLTALMGYFREFPLMKAENITAILVGLYLALFSTRKLEVAFWGYLGIILIFSPMTGTFACTYRHYLLAFPLHFLFGLSEKSPAVKSGFALCCLLIGLRHFFMLYMYGEMW